MTTPARGDFKTLLRRLRPGAPLPGAFVSMFGDSRGLLLSHPELRRKSVEGWFARNSWVLKLPLPAAVVLEERRSFVGARV
jgi:hypothetical protein